MKLYYSPGACSIGIHVLLEEVGRPFDLSKVDLAAGEQYRSEFAAINPKSKVPTLVRDDGSVLTEFPAIATWLALAHPEAALLPEDAEGRARALEAMDHAVGTIHMQGFARLYRPANFAPGEADREAVEARGRELAAKGFAIAADRMGGRDYVLGAFSVADAALFYVESWAARMGVDLPPACAAHLARMKARPAVARVLEAEGLAGG